MTNLDEAICSICHVRESGAARAFCQREIKRLRGRGLKIPDVSSRQRHEFTIRLPAFYRMGTTE